MSDDGVAGIASFGELLKFLRRRARLTQNQLAGAVGYSREHLARLESGLRPPDIAVVRSRLIEALELRDQPVLAERLIALAQAAHATAPMVIARPALPASLTRFVGRETLTREVIALLRTARLVTLVGSGGVGKTRLALRVAQVLAEAGQTDETGDVIFADLATVQEQGAVSAAVAAAAGQHAGKPAIVALIDHLSGRHCLLILDNCEHVLQACAALAHQLLQACPRVRVLATSREPLGMLGATVLRVPPLSLPDDSASGDFASESEQLFLDRARSVKPGFEAETRDAAALARLCLRLDGVPLAIELAAAQLRAMPLEQIARRLDDRFALLSSGNATASPRHQTLRAAIDWSYALLSDAEARLFRHLSVFVGGWSLDLLDGAVFEPSALAAHSALVDKSLLVFDERDSSAPRYRMLESIREFAALKLHEAAETQHARAIHLRLFTALAEQADPQLRQRDQQTWYRKLESEHDNLRAAHSWAVGLRDAPAAFRLLRALWFFWFWRGYWIEGAERARLTLAMAHDPNMPDARVAALAELMFASRSGNNAEFNAQLPRIQAFAGELDDP